MAAASVPASARFKSSIWMRSKRNLSGKGNASIALPASTIVRSVPFNTERAQSEKVDTYTRNTICKIGTIRYTVGKLIKQKEEEHGTIH